MAEALVFRAQVYQEDDNRIEEARNNAIRAAALDLLTVWRVLEGMSQQGCVYQ